MFPLRDCFWLLNNKCYLRQNNFCIVVRQATTSACQGQKQALLADVTLTVAVAPKDYLPQPPQPFLGNNNICTEFHGNQFTGCWDISVWTNVADRLSIPRAELLTRLNQNPLVIPATIWLLLPFSPSYYLKKKTKKKQSTTYTGNNCHFWIMMNTSLSSFGLKHPDEPCDAYIIPLLDPI